MKVWLMVIGVLAVLAMGFMPEYGACKVYSWDRDVAWLVWENAPVNPQGMQDNLFLKDLRTGDEFLTGVVDPFWISGNAYIPFYYKFGGSDFQIRNLTCVARYEGYTVETSNPGPWTLRHNWLPIAR